MMIDLSELRTQYITNEFGERVSVILPMVDFNALMEDLEDLAAVAERRDEPTVSHQQLVDELKQDGLL